ncbi:MAG: hypothetical protein IPP85_12110, partial [Propionivibrio sp.]|nr:hypothetical protein [Propionivibrio sp.]
IGLNITETGINLDFSQLNAELDARLAANPTAGLGDLMDFTIGTKEMLKDTGWVSTEKILNVIQTKSMGSEGESLFNDPGTRSFLFNEFGFQVKAGSSANETISGSNAAELILGFGGNDVLNGGVGNDTLEGGTGDDRLTGGDGNDTYIFRRGDGHDTIVEDSASSADTLILEGINPGDVSFDQSGYSLLIVLKDSGEYVNLQNFYLPDSRFQINVLKFADGTVWDRTTILAKEVNVFGGSGNDTIEARGNGPSTIYGYDGNDSITTTNTSGVSRVFGGAGNDTLSGYYGNDYFDGGAGDDRLTGNGGNDTYIYRRGDGHDTLIEDSASGADTLILEGINPTDITLEQTGYSLLIRIQGSDEWVNLQNFYLDTRFQIARIQFADGTVWDRSTILAKEVNRYGSSGNDTIEARSNGPSAIYGYDGNDSISSGSGVAKIFGGNGNDTLSGYLGNDYFDGGAGDDRLTGSSGNDTYIFRRGDGHDTIIEDGASGADTLILEGINPTDITLEQTGYSLLIRIQGSDEWVNLQNFYLDTRFQIASIQFANGTVWDRAAILAKEVNRYGGSGNDMIEGRSNGPSVIYGYDGNDSIGGGNDVDRVFGGNGNDTLTGFAGNDILDGGAGDDLLSGSGGNDTYVFRRGDGHDTIITNDYGPTDTLILEGINPGEIRLDQYGYSMFIVVKDTGEWVNVQNFYLGTFYQIGVTTQVHGIPRACDEAWMNCLTLKS